MRLIIIAACFVASYAAKLDRSYLPPASAKTAGGTPEILQTPFRSADESLPPGSFINESEGVVIDASPVDTRASGQSGLGGSRISYGSTDSKVGEAAFWDTTSLNQSDQTIPNPGILPNVHGFRQPVIVPGDQAMPTLEVERFNAARDRESSIIAYQNDIGTKDFNYAYQTDNGISVGENGIAVNGVRSQGGYSYTGDDGQVYTVSYTADEGGYRPQGAHLPTPPPIPVEILKALEQNAKDEAAGILDDGSYDASKYNTEDGTKDSNEQSVNGVGFNGINGQNEPTNQPHQQNNGLQTNQFNYEYTNEKQIDSIAHQYNNFGDVTTRPLEDSNVAQNAQSTNGQFNVPLSQQNLQNPKENGETPGRPNSYEAPISGLIQGSLNDGVKVFSNFNNKGKDSEQSQQTFNSGFASQFSNTNSQSESVNTVHSEFTNQLPYVIGNPNFQYITPFVTANSNFSNFGYRPLQHTNVFQPASTSNPFGPTNINREETKISSIIGSPQQTDRFHANSFNPFLHKQFALKNQQQKNQLALSSVFNSVNANKVSNVIPTQANKDYQYSTTLRPLDFSREHQTPDNANQLSLNSAYLPPRSFSFSSASQVNSGQAAQSAFRVTGSSSNANHIAVPSKLLTTPKEDMLQVSQGSSGITQASISPFPPTSSLASLNTPSNFDSSPQNSFPIQMVGSSFSPANHQSQNFGQAPLGANGFRETLAQVMNTQNLGEVYEYQKPVQRLPASSENPTFSQIQTTFNPQAQISNDETQTISQINFNQNQEATSSTTSKKSEDSASFAPKLLPSRPQFPKSSCCSASPNKQDTKDDQGIQNSGSGAQSFTSKAQSFSRSDNFRGIQTQDFDVTGYHY